MATKTIAENVVGTLSKGPLIVFVMFALGIWQASNMTDQQINTLERLITVLDNPVGAAIYFLGFFLIVYALLLFPSGKFIAVMVREFVKSQKAHNGETTDHIEASKGMYRALTTLIEITTHVKNKVDTFYGKG